MAIQDPYVVIILALLSGAILRLWLAVNASRERIEALIKDEAACQVKLTAFQVQFNALESRLAVEHQENRRLLEQIQANVPGVKKPESEDQ